MIDRVNRKIVVFLIVSFLLPLFVRGAVFAGENENRGWPNSPAIQAGAALVMDLNTGTVLVESNGNETFYPASITKIMTALIALENVKDLDEKVLFTGKAIEMVDPKSSRIGMRPGEELSLKDCLYGLMLASANEVANAIAIHVGGGIDEFADMMNEKAKELGCVNTHFCNPSGLHDPDHYTCALDMAKIAREALKYEDFKRIAGTRSYVIPETNLMKETRPVANYHQMINPAKHPEYAYEYCYAGKTGYTHEAGMTLVSYAKKGTMNLVCVVLKAATKDAQFGGTAKFFDYCFKRFRMEQAEKVRLDYENSDFYKSLKERDSQAKLFVPTAAMIVVPKKCDIHKVKAELLFHEIENLNFGENEVGRIKYSYNGKEIGDYPLLYSATEDFVLKEEVKKEEIIEEMVLPEKEEKGGSLIYKISLGIGGALGLVTLIVAFFYWKGRKRRRHLVHRSLRRRSNRKNRLW